MNTFPRSYHNKWREKMQTSRSTLVVLTAIILIGTVGLSLMVSSLYSAYIQIPGSGFVSLGYAPPLHVEGKDIKNDYGTVVYLRGAVKPQHLAVPGGWWHPEGSMNDYGYWVWNPEAVQYNLDKMVEFGFTCVRVFLPDVERWLNNEDPGIGITPRDEISYVIDQANLRGLYVMIVPWAVGDPYGGQTGIPWDPYTKPTERGVLTTPEDFINLWAGDQDSYSAEYGHFPNVIYELWNEPNGWTPDVDLHQLYFDTCQEIVNRLRAKGDEHLVVYQFNFTGADSNQAVGWGRILNGTNVVYASHVYRTLGGPRWPPYFNGDYLYEDVKSDLLNNIYIQNIIDNNLPLIMTEYGCLMNGPLVGGEPRENELTWYTNLHRCLNEWGFGYTAFEWRSYTSFAIIESNSQYPWLPPLNAAGEILTDSITAGRI